MKTNPKCRVCGVELNDENWFPSCQKKRDCICKSCNNERVKQWAKANPDKTKAQWTRTRRKQGTHPFDENRKCPSFLGVYVAERVLSHVFKNVQRMPFGHHGYDFICGRGYEIDVKSSCKMKNRDRWIFHINHNTVADYFLCLAFDNREDLNPLYIWLIPGDKINDHKGIAISQSTIHKWDEYRLDISKVITCCNTMKEKSEDE